MRTKFGVLFAVLLLIVFLGVGSYAGYQLYGSLAAYAKGDQTYEQILQQVISEDSPPSETAFSQEIAVNDAPLEPNTEETVQNAPVVVEVPSRSVDFTALSAINQDAVAWLYCPDTVIDYPVMAAEDYTYYLHHLPDGTENSNGSLFLDYGCQSDFSDPLSVIYGHNMKSGKMFGTLDNYKKQAYFEAHPYLYLYTEAQNYRITLIYGAVVSVDEWSEKGYMNPQNVEQLMEYAQAHTTFQSGEEWDGQPVVVLSTCSYEYEGARFFVVGLLQPEYLEIGSQ